MSEAEQRHRTISSARSRARSLESRLLAVPERSAPISRSRPLPRDAGVRTLFFGESTPLMRDLACELERTGMTAVIADEPERAAAGSTASRTLIFVDLGAVTEPKTALLASWHERLPHAVWIALGDDLAGEQAARLLAAGVTSIPKPIATSVLVELAHSLSQQSEPCPASSVEPRFRTGDDLSPALEAYSEERALSPQQRLILGSYLAGSNDKTIAERCGCSEATVYEHWRRMAKKAGGAHKADAINDFHRFLAGS